MVTAESVVVGVNQKTEWTTDVWVGSKEEMVERKTFRGFDYVATWDSIPADQSSQERPGQKSSSGFAVTIYPAVIGQILEMEALKKLWSILNGSTTPSPLDTMDLGPTTNTENPVMVSFLQRRPSDECLRFEQIQFFTWDCKHPELSWWKFFERTVPDLESLGFTQVWLPPPHKAMVKVHSALA